MRTIELKNGLQGQEMLKIKLVERFLAKDEEEEETAEVGP